MNVCALQLEQVGEGDELAPPFNTNDQLHEVDIPVLAVVGTLDRIRAIAGTRRIAETVPHARFAEIRDTAHLPSMEQPQTFDGLVLSFLASLGESESRDSSRPAIS